MNKKTIIIESLLFIAFIANAHVARISVEYFQALYILPLIAACFASSRYAVFAFLFAHYVGYGAPLAISPYFEVNRIVYMGYIAWIAQALLMSTPYLLAWHKDKKWRISLLLSVLIVTHVLPPFAFGSYGSPLIALGYLFPASSWFGFILIFALLIVLVCRMYWQYTLPAFAASMLIFNLLYRPAPIDQNWRALHTNMVQPVTFLDVYENLNKLNKYLRKNDADFIVTPEGVLYAWTNTVESSLVKLAAKHNKVIFVCADIQQDGDNHRSTFIVTSDGAALAMHQHMPPPLSMWRPWSEEISYSIQMRKGASFIIGDYRVSSLICYEKLIPWVNWLAHYDDPDIIIGMSNNDPVAKTSIGHAQNSSAKSWARLFNKPVYLSTNLSKGEHSE